MGGQENTPQTTSAKPPTWFVACSVCLLLTNINTTDILHIFTSNLVQPPGFNDRNIKSARAHFPTSSLLFLTFLCLFLQPFCAFDISLFWSALFPSQADSYPFLPYGLEEFPNGHSDLYHAARKL